MEAHTTPIYVLTAKGYEFFSKAEVQVLKLFLNGKNRRQIATELFRSYYTIKNHLTAIKNLLHTKSDVGIWEACVLEEYAEKKSVERS